ncbi:Alanine--tRNA ligase [Candidatus Providencia siddallii]|uniref:Alanine--tRNA ligase n=1 Tax=Candidatus Providencia siddallii TaxID=1715285 RepID=A0A0M6W8M1_9GAMM|nr:Alanine--tRNA ligase [Candidatus Providencia siddallii]
MIKSTDEIRQTFLEFFHKKNHSIIDGSSLIPNNDLTLLFTNAGMNQFKNIFLGTEKKEYSRAATVQHCVRAGGKHNDLENVGYTNRHHTFFEMLGNFSFGDYFKKDAIYFAWELLTNKKWFNLPKEKLLITVYDTDEESYDILNKNINIPKNKIIRIGDNKGKPYASDNFWQMSNTGPCGPCIEIFYDYGKHISGCIPGSNEHNGDRYIEIWNLVFMQFNRQSNGSLIHLPQLSVDTGMGLERISAVLQNVNSTYDIDIFRNLITTTASIINTTDLKNKSLRVVTDHIRSSAYLISNGVYPSNEGRGYVLRRIIRRAIRHGYKLGTKNIFFYKLINPLIKIMGITAKKIQQQQIIIEKILKMEEEQFTHTLNRGLQLLDKEIAVLKSNIIDGDIVFRLYDTYGFPLDLTIDICREHNINIDIEGFEIAMKKQRQRSKKINVIISDKQLIFKNNLNCEFSGYQHNKENTFIKAIYKNNLLVDSLYANENGLIILDKTPFFSESGGQISDTGIIYNNYGKFIVTDTFTKNQTIIHFGKIDSGLLSVKEFVSAEINNKRRINISINHSATHLLHTVLRIILGKHVFQKGSLINDKILRFDFSHFKALTQEQLQQIEIIINEQIRNNLKIKTELMSLKEAKTKDIISLLNNKYEKYVRVINIDNFSMELCCGTHVDYTGNIGLFHILNEYSISAGIRRIEAITGEEAIKNIHNLSKQFLIIKNILKIDTNNIVEKVKFLLKKSFQLEKTILQLKEKESFQKCILLSNEAKNIKNVKLLVTQLNCVSHDLLKSMVIRIKNQLKSAIVVLSTINNDKINIIVGITNELTNKIKADDLISYIAKQIDGKGGGRNDIAQGGGTNIEALPNALESVEEWVNLQL